ncbi:MAG: LCP family protein [Syntrophomonadaceae bacterium]|nr:LCP family protein [Syntrophomonadaceae bacterium]
MSKAITYIKIMLISGLVFGLFFGIGAGVTSLFTQPEEPVIAEPDEEEEVLERQDGERTNILVLGVDARPGETRSRSDTMMLVSIDPKLDKAAIISIPRDTKVEIPGSGTQKICAANVIGGPQFAVKTVENLMNVKIDYYVEMDFNGFEDIINTLGGVTIDVPQKMYKPSEGIDLKPGVQKLNGKDALAFVRFRDYVNGDIDRTVMQQTFIKALADEVLQPKTITKLPKLVSQVNQYVNTNMGIKDMLRIASWAPGFNSESIATQTLPGSFYDVRDEYGNLINSYWVADKSSLNGLIDNLMSGKTIAVVQGIQQVQTPPAQAENDDKNDGKEEIRVGEREQKKPDNQERAILPSPGHGGEYDNLTPPISSGPEGYI